MLRSCSTIVGTTVSDAMCADIFVYLLEYNNYINGITNLLPYCMSAAGMSDNPATVSQYTVIYPTAIIVASPDAVAPILVALVVLGNARSCLNSNQTLPFWDRL